MDIPQHDTLEFLNWGARHCKHHDRPARWHDIWRSWYFSCKWAPSIDQPCYSPGRSCSSGLGSSRLPQGENPEGSGQHQHFPTRTIFSGIKPGWKSLAMDQDSLFWQQRVFWCRKPISGRGCCLEQINRWASNLGL